MESGQTRATPTSLISNLDGYDFGTNTFQRLLKVMSLIIVSETEKFGFYIEITVNGRVDQKVL